MGDLLAAAQQELAEAAGDGQIFDPDHPDDRLFATHFCRNCGQEHHPVMLRDADGTPRFEKREIDDVPLNEDDDPDGSGGRWGFLMPEPVDGQFDFQGRDEDYPDVWLDGDQVRRDAAEGDLSEEPRGTLVGSVGRLVRARRTACLVHARALQVLSRVPRA